MAVSFCLAGRSVLYPPMTSDSAGIFLTTDLSPAVSPAVWAQLELDVRRLTVWPF